MHNIAETVEIKNIGNQLIFSCKGDFCSQETIIVDNENGTNTIAYKKNSNDIVQGIFNLKYLTLFAKCSNLCGTVELMLKNDYPIVIRYLVASLGCITLALAPCSQND
jgi:proliferating cell nuclear antigen